MTQLKPGDKAPNFNLQNQDGEKVKLGDFKGQKLLIYFYPRANTPGCTTQSCAVSEARPTLKKKKIGAVGVSPDTPDKQLKFDEKFSLGFPLLCDTDFKVAKAYGAFGTKKSFGKVREGIIRSSFLIDEKGKIIDAWYKVKPDDTVPQALEAAGG
jgi:peroxiredoxin Q/BCP